jgi:hypothetical protein
VAYSGTDFHRADVAPSQAHSSPHASSGNPGETLTGPRQTHSGVTTREKNYQ